MIINLYYIPEEYEYWKHNKELFEETFIKGFKEEVIFKW